MKLTPADLDAVAEAVLARLTQRAPALLETLRPQDPRVALTIDTVLQFRHCSRGQMLSTSRAQPGVFGRAVGMWLLREVWGLPYAEIATAFGRSDHATAMAACRTVEDRRDTEPNTRRWTDRARRHLASLSRGYHQQAASAALLDEILEAAKTGGSPIPHRL